LPYSKAFIKQLKKLLKRTQFILKTFLFPLKANLFILETLRKEISSKKFPEYRENATVGGIFIVFLK
jgi:mRNA-degrading endonuclease RelE of RelBE toxin-antitoxin system